MAQLRGYAIPITGVPADHTYADSDDGYVWPCWGRSAGGARITAGNGSSTQANCLSQTNSHAGLIYAVTGVCHQTANRILYPARVLVSRARGYGLSVAIYGTYGSDGAAWPARIAVCTRISGSGRGGVVAQQRGHDDFADELYVERVIELYTTGTPGSRRDRLSAALEGDRLRFAELALLSEFRLGSDEPVRALRERQVQLVEQKNILDGELLSGTRDPMSYANEVNGLAAQLVSDAAVVIGPAAAERLFDHTPGQPTAIVEPEIIIDVYGNNPRQGIRR